MTSASGALYSSPFLCATPGSTHGYDVTDYRSLNPEIGTEGDLDTLSGGAAGTRHGPARGRGAEPHGYRRRRERLVAGRARERPHLSLRRVLRHRLAATERGAARQDPAPGPWRSLRHRAGARGAGPQVRRRRVHGSLLRDAPTDRPHHLPDDPHDGPGRGPAPLSCKCERCDGRGAGGEGVSSGRRSLTCWNSRASSPRSSGCHPRTSATPT